MVDNESFIENFAYSFLQHFGEFHYIEKSNRYVHYIFIFSSLDDKEPNHESIHKKIGGCFSLNFDHNSFHENNSIAFE